MFTRYFYRVFFHEAKRYPFIKPQIKPFLNKSTRIFPISRCTVTGASYSTDSSVVDIKEGYDKKQVELRYFLDNKDKYLIVDTDNINLDETRSEALKLLKNLANDADATNEVSIKVENLLEYEVKKYDLEDIFKFIILCSQLYIEGGKIWRVLDTALYRRKFSLVELLKILFVMKQKHVNYRYMPKFTYAAQTKLITNINKLNPYKVTQLFYEMEKLPHVSVVLKYSIQDTLMKTITQLNAFELGLITERLRILNVVLSYTGVLEAIMEKTIKELDNVDGYVFNKISRLLAEQLRFFHGPALLKFQEALIPHLPRFNQINARSAVLLGSSINCINSNIWNATMKYLKQNIDLVSTTDIERMLFATTIYNIKDAEFLELVAEQFESKEGRQKSIRCLLYVIVHLIHHGIFNEKLLGIICSENFTSLYNLGDFNFEMKLAYMFINSSLIIEKPTANFHQLYFAEKMDAFQLFGQSDRNNPLMSRTYHYIKKAMITLEKLYGRNTTKIKRCLPYTEGILMRFDENFRVQTFEEPPQNVQHLKDGHRWLYVMIVPKADFLYESTTPTLQFQTKLRHLKIKGYEPLLVPLNDFSKSYQLGKGCELMKDLIDQHLQEGCNKE